jgi:hypothetical protein
VKQFRLEYQATLDIPVAEKSRIMQHIFNQMPRLKELDWPYDPDSDISHGIELPTSLTYYLAATRQDLPSAIVQQQQLKHLTLLVYTIPQFTDRAGHYQGLFNRLESLHLVYAAKKDSPPLESLLQMVGDVSPCCRAICFELRRFNAYGEEHADMDLLVRHQSPPLFILPNKSLHQDVLRSCSTIHFKPSVEHFSCIVDSKVTTNEPRAHYAKILVDSLPKHSNFRYASISRRDTEKRMFNYRLLERPAYNFVISANPASGQIFAEEVTYEDWRRAQWETT